MDIPTSLSLARIRGTAVRLHLLSVLTVAWYGLLHAAGDVDAVIRLGGLVGALIIHEFGHYIAARILGVGIEKTVILPFGSVSVLKSKLAPMEEVAYRLAGPVANLLVLLSAISLQDSFSTIPSTTAELLREVSVWCTLIGAVNLLPLHPLDGGGIFDTANRTRTGYKSRSFVRIFTPISIIGLLALGWSLIDPVPVAAAIGVAVSAARRAAKEHSEALIGDLTVGEVMIPVTSFTSLTHGTTVAGSIEEVIRSTETVFVVSHGDTPIGFVFRSDIVDTAVTGERRYLAELIDRELTMIEESTPLENILERIGVDTTDPLMICRGRDIRGLVFREQIIEFLLLRNAARDDESIIPQDRPC